MKRSVLHKRDALSDRKRRETLTAYLFIAPDLIGLIVFVMLPILFAFYISLFDWDMVREPIFVGLRNYQTMVKDVNWWRSLGRTLHLTVIYVPCLFCLSLLIAVLVSQARSRALSPIKTFFLLPFAITSVIASTLWMFLYNEKRGYINAILRFLGFPAQSFLSDTSQALACIIIVLLWINIGYNMTLFIAAIKDIPSSYFEAAKLDGASRWNAFRHITFPLLRQSSVFVLVTTTIASFQVMDLIMVMTKGGPAKATEVAALYIYDRSFGMMKMGYGSALSVCLFLLLLLLSLLQSRLTSGKGVE